MREYYNNWRQKHRLPYLMPLFKKGDKDKEVIGNKMELRAITKLCQYCDCKIRSKCRTYDRNVRRKQQPIVLRYHGNGTLTTCFKNKDCGYA